MKDIIVAYIANKASEALAPIVLEDIKKESWIKDPEVYARNFLEVSESKELLRQLAERFLDEFSEEERIGLHTFLLSPLGQKLMSKHMSLFNSQLSYVQKWYEERNAALQKMTEEHLRDRLEDEMAEELRHDRELRDRQYSVALNGLDDNESEDDL